MPRRYRPRHAAVSHRTRRRGSLLRVLGILLLLLVLAYPFAETRLLQVEYTSVTCSDLPSDVSRLRIVYVSDIHEGFFYSQSEVDSLVRKINSLNADLVLLGGDYATDSDSAITFFENLPSISARYAVYAVLGEDDRSLPESNLPLLKTAMSRKSITPLVNSVESVRIGSGSTIYIAGIDDVTNGSPDIASVAGSVKESDFVILMCHNPSAITSILQQSSSDGHRSWFDLGLFGHTHGGQILPLSSLMPSTSGVQSSYVSGWTTANRIPLLISHGVGTSTVPIRLFCRPQIHVITVTSS